ncbi:MAG: C4-dicarboxylic acid transporter DauA [Bdellovibrionota bacterium]
MMSRYFRAADLSLIKLRPFSALRDVLHEGYSLTQLRTDLLAGIVVALVAVPLGMALGIASGVAPQNGLYTVIFAGFTVALLGGSRCQVTGPTAAFVVILLPIVSKFGLGGLLTAGLLSGIILVVMGAARMGQLIRFIPFPVTTGFTSGIAVVIATLQFKDFFGLKPEHLPESYLGRVSALFHARGTAEPIEFAVGICTLAILILWPRINKKIPAPLVALSTAALGVYALRASIPELEIATIQSRFNGIPAGFPDFQMPWNFSGAEGRPLVFNLELIRDLMPSAFAIAMLGAIESLLSAVVADGMARTRHDPDAELVALGTGNLICPFFGGIPATGAIARTATNVRYGGRTPIASMVHALFTLLILLILAPLVSKLPMASLAALLILVAYNMSEVRHFFHILKAAPKSDVIVLLTCFFLTVIFDMVVGVTVGIVLAALLFMRRMAELTSTQNLTGKDSGKGTEIEVPRGVVLYHIAGPLFFGAAEKAVGTIATVRGDFKVLILLMEDVPTLDITGMVALEGVIQTLIQSKKSVILTGVQSQPRSLLEKSRLKENSSKFIICTEMNEAVEMAKKAMSESTG